MPQNPAKEDCSKTIAHIQNYTEHQDTNSFLNPPPHPSQNSERRNQDENSRSQKEYRCNDTDCWILCQVFASLPTTWTDRPRGGKRAPTKRREPGAKRHALQLKAKGLPYKPRVRIETTLSGRTCPTSRTTTLHHTAAAARRRGARRASAAAGALDRRRRRHQTADEPSAAAAAVAAAAGPDTGRSDRRCECYCFPIPLPLPFFRRPSFIRPTMHCVKISSNRQVTVSSLLSQSSVRPVWELTISRAGPNFIEATEGHDPRGGVMCNCFHSGVR